MNTWNYKTKIEEALELTSSREILLWMSPSEAAKALRASECSELLDPMRASVFFVIYEHWNYNLQTVS